MHNKAVEYSDILYLGLRISKRYSDLSPSSFSLRTIHELPVVWEKPLGDICSLKREQFLFWGILPKRYFYGPWENMFVESIKRKINCVAVQLVFLPYKLRNKTNRIITK